MSREIELLTEIRDLLSIIAEPALAERDAKLRASLRKAASNSNKRKEAVFLMDGTRPQSAIAKEVKLDASNLSRFIKNLKESQLLSSDEKYPKLALSIPPAFFDQKEED